VQDVKREWGRIRARAKLHDVTVHDLRRTAGSWMTRSGVPMRVIGEALGHRDMRATHVYARIAATDAADALDQLGTAMAGLARTRAKRRHA
jgi:integrase